MCVPAIQLPRGIIARYIENQPGITVIPANDGLITISTDPKNLYWKIYSSLSSSPSNAPCDKSGRFD